MKKIKKLIVSAMLVATTIISTCVPTFASDIDACGVANTIASGEVDLTVNITTGYCGYNEKTLYTPFDIVSFDEDTYTYTSPYVLEIDGAYNANTKRTVVKVSDIDFDTLEKNFKPIKKTMYGFVVPSKIAKTHTAGDASYSRDELLASTKLRIAKFTSTYYKGKTKVKVKYLDGSKGNYSLTVTEADRKKTSKKYGIFVTSKYGDSIKVANKYYYGYFFDSKKELLNELKEQMSIWCDTKSDIMAGSFSHLDDNDKFRPNLYTEEIKCKDNTQPFIMQIKLANNKALKSAKIIKAPASGKQVFFSKKYLKKSGSRYITYYKYRYVFKTKYGLTVYLNNWSKTYKSIV